ncbi:MAG TPA: META domain-containing protein [Methanolinea sp.]|nr:META domain-containing protein [Methanolinea sp.]HQK54935.1 META domain-containing protein [Methanolinea sp.]
MKKAFACLIPGLLVLALCTCGCSMMAPNGEIPSGAGDHTGSAASGEVTGLEGVTWHLFIFHTASGRSAEVLPGTEITASFGSDGMVSGLAGCNRYRASCKEKEGRLSVRDLAVTELYCGSPSGIMSQEAMYLSFLQRTAGYSIENRLLTLTNAEGKPLLSFTPGQPRSP